MLYSADRLLSIWLCQSFWSSVSPLLAVHLVLWSCRTDCSLSPFILPPARNAFLPLLVSVCSVQSFMAYNSDVSSSRKPFLISTAPTPVSASSVHFYHCISHTTLQLSPLQACDLLEGRKDIILFFLILSRVWN